MFFRYIFEYITDYSDEKSNLHQIAIVHYIKNMYSSNILSNKLRQQLIKKWSNVVSNMDMVSEYTKQNKFINVNQFLLENNIISSMVNKLILLSLLYVNSIKLLVRVLCYNWF